MSPELILRNRLQAVGVQITPDQALGAVQALRSQGYKLTVRDCGESGDVAMRWSGKDEDGSRKGELVSQDPRQVWAVIWDQFA